MVDDYLKQFEIEGFEEYSREAVKEGIKLATQKACQRHFRTQRCEVDLYNKVVTVVFVMSKNRSAFNALLKKFSVEHYEYEELVPAIIPLDKLFEIEKRVIRMTRQHLREMIIDSHERLTYNKWKVKKNELVEGVVVYDEDPQYLEVEVNGTICRMDRRFGVKREKGFLYKKGKKFWFHVSNVSSGNGRPNCKITLTRRSLKLPELLLKRALPEYDFECHKRWPGDLCWISTNAIVGDKSVVEVRQRVSRELSGEKIILKNNFKPGEIGKGHK